MTFLSLFTKIYIIFSIYYCLNGLASINNCAILYIPDEPYKDSNKNLDMILFINKDNKISSTDISGVGSPATEVEIKNGKYFTLSDNIKLKIDLESTNDHICDIKYRDTKTERQVTLDNDVHSVKGYIYRNSDLNSEEYETYNKDALYEIARESVPDDSTFHSKKRSKYIAVCIGGENTWYAEYRCYGLDNDVARKAYIKRPYYLKSKKESRTIRCDGDYCTWDAYLRRYDIHTYPESETVGTSECYYKFSWGGRLKVEGRMHFVSDETYDSVDKKIDYEARAIIEKESVEDIPRPNCRS